MFCADHQTPLTRGKEREGVEREELDFGQAEAGEIRRADVTEWVRYLRDLSGNTFCPVSGSGNCQPPERFVAKLERRVAEEVRHVVRVPAYRGERSKHARSPDFLVRSDQPTSHREIGGSSGGSGTRPQCPSRR